MKFFVEYRIGVSIDPFLVLCVYHSVVKIDQSASFSCCHAVTIVDFIPKSNTNTNQSCRDNSYSVLHNLAILIFL